MGPIASIVWCTSFTVRSRFIYKFSKMIMHFGNQLLKIIYILCVCVCVTVRKQAFSSLKRCRECDIYVWTNFRGYFWHLLAVRLYLYTIRGRVQAFHSQTVTGEYISICHRLTLFFFFSLFFPFIFPPSFCRFVLWARYLRGWLAVGTVLTWLTGYGHGTYVVDWLWARNWSGWKTDLSVDLRWPCQRRKWFKSNAGICCCFVCF